MTFNSRVFAFKAFMREFNSDKELKSDIFSQQVDLQLKKTNELKEENDSLKINFQLLQQELKTNKEERAKREEENNLQKCQIETLIKEIEELKNGLLLLTEVNKEKENEGLISKGDTKDIWDAAEKGSLPAVKFYLKENPQNIDKGDEDYYNYTPLHYASRDGRLDIAKYLIWKKVNFDSINSDCTTPLMLASWNAHLSIMDLLLDSGANINQQDKDKWTPLHYAVRGDNLDSVKLLINKGADKTLRDIQNETPLELAKSENETSIVEYLSSL